MWMVVRQLLLDRLLNEMNKRTVWRNSEIFAQYFRKPVQWNSGFMGIPSKRIPEFMFFRLHVEANRYQRFRLNGLLSRSLLRDSELTLSRTRSTTVLRENISKP